MSYQTTVARAAARALADAWRGHKSGCPVCEREARRRNWGKLCAAGAPIFTQHTQAAAALAAQIKLDRQPAPGQGVLL